MALKCSSIVEYSSGINFFPAFFGLVEVFVPEQRIRAVAVFAWTDGGSGSEKTVGRIPFEIRSISLGMDSRIPTDGHCGRMDMKRFPWLPALRNFCETSGKNRPCPERFYRRC